MCSIFSEKHYTSSSMDISSNQLISPYCSSSSSCRPTWDVFLSFYGKDTRKNFIAHLYFALDQAGILTFRDDPALEKGQEISLGLCNAIKDSNMFIVVLSENYARSEWCLNELVEILSCKRASGQVVPVFYYVDPSDIRHQTGSFGEALDFDKKRYSVDIIEKWKSALAEIAELSGYHLKKEANENELVQEIVETVASHASTKVLHLEEYLFGIDFSVDEIYQKLSMESNDVRAIGICGMGGIGKTTIAKAFYNKYYNKFDISCFIEKQNSQGGSPLLPLLRKLLIELLRRKDYIVRDVESGIRKLKQLLCSKKSLIVLDGLDQLSYMEFLVRVCSFFNVGSRIIITTRDANLLNQLKVDISEVDIYMLKELGQVDSLELFSYHAFGKLMPPKGFIELSMRFVTYAGGLPLALKVLGSSLRGRTQLPFWKAKLEKVLEIPENEIKKILQLSYDELGDEREKAIFLDIAFFFVERDKDEAVHIFKSCGLYPEAGIPILVERCLLSIDKNNRFQMHNLIQDMGKELGKSTRLFLRGNAWKDLPNLEIVKGANKIEGLILDLTLSTERQMTSKIFERLSNLRLLEIIDAPQIKGNFKNSFHELRCIRWGYCPWTCLPLSFRPQKLVSLDMPFSEFRTLWKSAKPIKQLTNLGRLDLVGCRNMKQLPKQLGYMKGLKRLDVSNTALEQLPDSIAHLKELVELILYNCKKLRKLPEQFGDMEGLKIFDASGSAIEELPDSVVDLKELVELRLFRCRKLRKLPEQFGNIEGLRTFDASFTMIEQLPDSISCMKKLVGIKLMSCKKLRKLPEQFGNIEGLRMFDAGDSAIEQLPDSFGRLINLTSLHLSECQNLTSLPNSIWKLKLLTILDLDLCSKLERLPEQMGKMQCLKMLYANSTAIEQLPDSIGLLRLYALELSHCDKLKYLPNSIWNLTSLTILSLRCNIRLLLPMILSFSLLECLHVTDEGRSSPSTKRLSLYMLSNLRNLTLENCTSLGSSFPELPLNLEELKVYNYATLEHIPDLSSLKQLKSLHIHRCISLRSLSLLPLRLQLLKVHECTGLHNLPDLSMLKKLAILSFIGCNNLKSVGLSKSSLQGGLLTSYKADIPNREIAEWFSNKSSGCTLSFDIPPKLGHNFLGVLLWIVYTCKTTDTSSNIRAVIMNKTKSTTQNYNIHIDGVGEELQSRVEYIRRDRISVESGERINVSFQNLLSSYKGTGGKVKVEKCGAHVVQNTPGIP